MRGELGGGRFAARRGELDLRREHTGRRRQDPARAGRGLRSEREEQRTLAAAPDDRDELAGLPESESFVERLSALHRSPVALTERHPPCQ